jgi:ribosomal subunit interface protein
MDLVMKSRGTRITDHMRASALRKLSRLERMEPRVLRLEVEILTERNPRLGGIKTVEGALETPRHTFRAKAHGDDVDSALDQLVEKLERQVRDHNTKRRTRLITGGGRLKSARGGQEPAGSE